jgi:hypothetical protein
VTSQERGAAQEGLGSGTIASYSVAIPAAMIANTSCKPRNSWFQKSAPIEHFYRFLCRAEKATAYAEAHLNRTANLGLPSLVWKSSRSA